MDDFIRFPRAGCYFLQNEYFLSEFPLSLNIQLAVIETRRQIQRKSGSDQTNFFQILMGYGRKNNDWRFFDIFFGRLFSWFSMRFYCKGNWEYYVFKRCKYEVILFVPNYFSLHFLCWLLDLLNSQNLKNLMIHLTKI